VAPRGAGTAGTSGELVGIVLGDSSAEYREWNALHSERDRATVILKALDQLFEMGERVVANPPDLPTRDFKSHIEFKRWIYNADEDERTVAEAFGVKGLQRFTSLSTDAARSSQRSQELDDLYRAAVVWVVVWHWAVYLTL
jgi:hypothetical protein